MQQSHDKTPVDLSSAGAGETFDLSPGERSGASLLGRVNRASCPVAFAEILQRVAGGQLSPSQAAWVYDEALKRLGIRPPSANGAAGQPANPSGDNTHGRITRSAESTRADCGCGCGGAEPGTCGESNGAASSHTAPEFSKMTRAEKLAYNQAKRDRIFGRFS